VCSLHASLKLIVRFLLTDLWQQDFGCIYPQRWFKYKSTGKNYRGFYFVLSVASSQNLKPKLKPRQQQKQTKKETNTQTNHTSIKNQKKKTKSSKKNFFIRCKEDHRTYRRNFCSCEKKAKKKKIRLVRDSNPWIPVQRSNQWS